MSTHDNAAPMPDVWSLPPRATVPPVPTIATAELDGLGCE